MKIYLKNTFSTNVCRDTKNENDKSNFIYQTRKVISCENISEGCKQIIVKHCFSIRKYLISMHVYVGAFDDMCSRARGSVRVYVCADVAY